jgi:hypothetical protein
MEDRPQRISERSGDYVHFWITGDGAKGEFHCSDCGYGVTVYRELPLCPMCGCTFWEEAAWSPFSRSPERA